jgi:hypothetical protein
MAKVFSVWNGASIAAAPVPVTTGTAIKTMIQLSTPATADVAIVEWSWEGDGFAAAAPGVVDLQFHSGAATVTAHVAADIKKYSVNDVASLMTLGTANGGYTASAEGTATAMFNVPHQVPPTAGFYVQYPQGREPKIAASSFCGLRNKFGTAINAICSVAWEE